MKKVKNSELNLTVQSLENIKEGKIRKIKNKIVKKLKDVTKLSDQKLSQKTEQTSEPSKIDGGSAKSKKKNKKSKNKLGQQQEKLVVNEDEASKLPQDVANDENRAEKKKKKKVKKDKLQKEEPTANAVSIGTENHKELTEADIKKIEKKKAKKLAQKLKKQQKLKKASGTDNMDSAKTNGVEKVKPADKDIGLTNTKVLTKKEKKAKKRQLIKEQKLAEKQTRDPAVEAATIFVGNLPVNTKRLQLVKLFKDYAPVNSIRLRSAGGKVLHKHKQRKEAGTLSAYVVLKDKETAEKAVSLNGTEFKGHHLRITLASKNQHHDNDQGKRTVFVGNLKYTATEEALREVFSSCGEIEYVRCLRDGDKGCKGVAYVCFKTPDSVGLALELNETVLDERPIHVERFSVKKLGAKEAREAEAEKEKTSKRGPKLRIDGKRDKGNKSAQKKTQNTEDNGDRKPKKSEFRGVKVETLKKKQKFKKKKSNNQMLELAKKIAPKINKD